jgi:hypothetical protein
MDEKLKRKHSADQDNCKTDEYNAMVALHTTKYNPDKVGEQYNDLSN